MVHKYIWLSVSGAVRLYTCSSPHSTTRTHTYICTYSVIGQILTYIVYNYRLMVVETRLRLDGYVCVKLVMENIIIHVFLVNREC